MHLALQKLHPFSSYRPKKEPHSLPILWPMPSSSQAYNSKNNMPSLPVHEALCGLITARPTWRVSDRSLLLDDDRCWPRHEGCKWAIRERVEARRNYYFQLYSTQIVCESMFWGALPTVARLVDQASGWRPPSKFFFEELRMWSYFKITCLS